MEYWIDLYKLYGDKLLQFLQEVIDECIEKEDYENCDKYDRIRTDLLKWKSFNLKNGK